MYANHRIQPTANAARTDNTFFANVYAPPDSGNTVDISVTLIAVSHATTPLRASARIAAGPAELKAVPARISIPPPRIPPSPTRVAPNTPIRRCDSSLIGSQDTCERRCRASVAADLLRRVPSATSSRARSADAVGCRMSDDTLHAMLAKAVAQLRGATDLTMDEIIGLRALPPSIHRPEDGYSLGVIE